MLDGICREPSEGDGMRDVRLLLREQKAGILRREEQSILNPRSACGEGICWTVTLGRSIGTGTPTRAGEHRLPGCIQYHQQQPGVDRQARCCTSPIIPGTRNIWLREVRFHEGP